MSKYLYKYHDERGEFRAFVIDENQNVVWSVNYPDYYEDEESGELIESSTIFDDGFMKNAEDVEGLEDYLKKIGILQHGDELYDEEDDFYEDEEEEDEDDYEKGGGVKDEGSKKNELREFLEYEGILGYTNRIHEIMMGRDDEFKPTELGEYLSDPDGDGFGIFGYTRAIREIYEDNYEKGGNVVIKTASNLIDRGIEQRRNVVEKVGQTRDRLIGRMEKGGDLKKYVSSKLKGQDAFDLPLELAVYVPSTKGVDSIISKREYNDRIEETQRFLSNLFGGFSSVKVEGGYMSDDKGLVQEDVTRVVAFSNPDGFKEKLDVLLHKIVDWCKIWTQESIGFEYEGDLFYISSKSTFEHGGEMDIRMQDTVQRMDNPHLADPSYYEEGGLTK
jgi:hypothetical protein